ncbi:lysozyme, partial [Salmonella enterica subsp. enterica]|nr:lysozyme [Salmonella enterica subsp. enterica]
MNISDRGVALIKTFEGCRLKAYPDPKTGGAPWTIGYGWTGKVDGKPVTPDTVIAQETADRLLKTGLVSYERDVSRLVKVKLTQGQFDALVSFVYNL